MWTPGPLTWYSIESSSSDTNRHVQTVWCAGATSLASLPYQQSGTTFFLVTSFETFAKAAGRHISRVRWRPPLWISHVRWDSSFFNCNMLRFLLFIPIRLVKFSTHDMGLDKRWRNRIMTHRVVPPSWMRLAQRTRPVQYERNQRYELSWYSQRASTWVWHGKD